LKIELFDLFLYKINIGIFWTAVRNEEMSGTDSIYALKAVGDED
jgi:hypothetical protein